MAQSSNDGRGEVKDRENDGRLKENEGGSKGGGGGRGSSERGFAAMSKEKQREIAKKGGEASQGGGRSGGGGRGSGGGR